MPTLDKETWLAMAREGHARSAFGRLGGEVLDVDEHSLTLRLPITDALRQPFGLLHGGISLFLIETAASSHAAFGADLELARPVGIEVSASHLRSATAGTLRATARLLRRGRTHAVHEVDVLLEESGELLCRGRMTNYFKPVE
ncbi:MAG: PaaI family thioesterase [Anaerolineales bacterium]|nr:PaaI family thioesterase [Anaerolineales bacterium]